MQAWIIDIDNLLICVQIHEHKWQILLLKLACVLSCSLRWEISIKVHHQMCEKNKVAHVWQKDEENN